MENVVKKLLESNEPSIRLRTRTEVLGESIESRTAREIQQEVKRSERVRALLSERKNGILPWHPYAKWYGAHWVLSALADLGYPSGDKSLIPLREQVYEWLFSKGHLEYVEGTRPSLGRLSRFADSSELTHRWKATACTTFTPWVWQTRERGCWRIGWWNGSGLTEVGTVTRGREHIPLPSPRVSCLSAALPIIQPQGEGLIEMSSNELQNTSWKGDSSSARGTAE